MWRRRYSRSTAARHALLTAAAAMLGVALVVGLVIGGVAMIALKDVVG